MATTLTQTHALLTVPFSSATDFTVLSAHSEHFADAMIESEDPALTQALCGRLMACLHLLRTTLDKPVPPHLVKNLTADTLAATEHIFEPDLLCDYCLALGKLLTERTLSHETEPVLTGLLAELVWNLTAELNAPRWERTETKCKVC